MSSRQCSAGPAQPDRRAAPRSRIDADVRLQAPERVDVLGLRCVRDERHQQHQQDGDPDRGHHAQPSDAPAAKRAAVVEDTAPGGAAKYERCCDQEQREQDSDGKSADDHRALLVIAYEDGSQVAGDVEAKADHQGGKPGEASDQSARNRQQGAVIEGNMLVHLVLLNALTGGAGTSPT